VSKTNPQPPQLVTADASVAATRRPPQRCANATRQSETYDLAGVRAKVKHHRWYGAFDLEHGGGGACGRPRTASCTFRGGGGGVAHARRVCRLPRRRECVSFEWESCSINQGVPLSNLELLWTGIGALFDSIAASSSSAVGFRPCDRWRLTRTARVVRLPPCLLRPELVWDSGVACPPFDVIQLLSSLALDVTSIVACLCRRPCGNPMSPWSRSPSPGS